MDPNITSPGATIALGFMHMKTNNQFVADLIPLPETPFLVDYVKPEFLFLRYFLLLFTFHFSHHNKVISEPH
jgi:anaphase-promoting complex subunit 1